MTPEQYTALGFRPFPCKNKEPVRCTTWPNSEPFKDGDQVAIPTPEGAVCIDLDMKPDVDGVALFSGLAPNGWTHTGPKARTGGGGVHLWFRVSPALEIGCGRGDLPVGIDVKGHGGYLIAPPSIHHETGAQYEWIRPMVSVDKMPELPRWILARILAKKNGKPKLSENAASAAGKGDNPDYVRGVLRTACDNVVSATKGERNDVLFYETVNAAKYLHYGVFSERDLSENMRTAASQAGLSESETYKTINSALKEALSKGERKTAPKQDQYSAPGETKSTDGWPVPKKLPSTGILIPDIDIDLIPFAFRAWLQREAEEICVPLSGLAVGAMIALATVVGRGVQIKPERNGKWTVTPNLWGAIVAPPGFMKSAVFAAALSPLDPLIEKARSEYVDQTDARRSTLIVLRSRLKKEQRKASPDAQEIDLLLDDIDGQRVVEKRHIINDATIEKLQMIQADNPKGVAYIRDELAGWIIGFDKQGRDSDRKYCLEGWDGSGSSRIDRVTRETTIIESNCLNVLGTIQPSLITPLVDSSITGTQDDGLIQRFQLLVFVDRLPDFHPPTALSGDPPNKRVLELFDILDGRSSYDKPRQMRFDEPGQVIFDEWRAKTEARYRGDEFDDNAARGKHLAKYRSLMPSLAALFCLLSEVDMALDGASMAPPRDDITRIGVECTQLAVRWTEYLETHVSRLYGIDVDPGIAYAETMLSKIESRAIVDAMPIRDIRRAQWSGLTKADAVDEAIRVLESCRIARLGTLGTGRNQTQILNINPALIIL